MADHDLLVIGGGPAGMAAARTVAAAGLSVAVIDEQPRPGGQILRQPPQGFEIPGWLPGRAYREPKAELAAFQAAPGIAWHGGRSAIGLAREGAGFVVHAAGAADMLRLTARRVLVATGCYDLPVPLPGWTTPGVLSAGAAQTFVKSQQIVPGDRFVFAGTHPLMLVVAAQIVDAGGMVAMVAFDQPFARFLSVPAAHPAAALRSAGIFAEAATALRTLRRAGVSVRYGLPLTRIEGEAVVTAARFGEARVACDRVALCYGFVPQSDLPRLAGAAIEWAEPAGGWRTRHDDWMQTDVPGLSIAGEVGGVAGAAIAIAEGKLAALGILRAEARAVDDAPLRRRLTRLRGFADLLAAIADPREVLARAVPDDTLLCRCEDVTHGAVAAMADERAPPNAIKLATRCGMGLCQGRTCEPALTRLLARTTGTRPDPAQAFAARFPVRPVRIGDLVASIATNSASNPD